MFDPSLKKKKKKKKTPFDLDAAMDEENKENKAVDGGEDGKEDPVAGDADEDADLESFGKKKKKKKKIVFDGEADVTAAAEVNGEEESGGAATAAAADKEDEEAALEDIDLESFGIKKKKKKTRLDMDELGETLPETGEPVVAEGDLNLESFGKKKKKKKRLPADVDVEEEETEDNKGNEAAAKPWMDSDRDYTYDELLQRVYTIMTDKNPEMVAGEKKKFVMRPPQVMRVGTKKTAFVNFTEIAKMLHRQPKHLLAFLFAELGTVGAIDGSQQLIMKGRFQQKHIENVLRRYIKEYVTCHTCRSPDTILNKETRLFFLQCMTCHSRCSVQAIKSGFQAVTGKRSAIRAKT